MKSNFLVRLTAYLIYRFSSAVGFPIWEPEPDAKLETLIDIVKKSTGTVYAAGWKVVESSQWNCRVGIPNNENFSDDTRYTTSKNVIMTFHVQRFNPLFSNAEEIAVRTISTMVAPSRTYLREITREKDGTFYLKFIEKRCTTYVIGRVYIKQDLCWMLCSFVNEKDDHNDPELRHFFDNFQITR